MSYRFATKAQFDACLFAQANRTHGEVRPFAPYARQATVYASRGGHAPAVTRARELLWRDDDGALHRLSDCGAAIDIQSTPSPIARAKRIVTTSRGLWVIGDREDSLQLFAEDSLTRLLSVEFSGARVVDLASAGQDSLWALLRRGEQWQAVHVDCAGHVIETVLLAGANDAIAMVFLRRTERFVILTGGTHPRLSWFSKEGGSSIFSLSVAGLRPCFEATVLGSDAKDLVFLAGVDGRSFGGHASVLIYDADGNALGDVPLDVPATGVVAMRDRLFVTNAQGLLQFDAADVVPENAPPVQFTVATPVLFSPDREDRRRWLRIEATTSLPEGSMLEIAWGATDDAPTRDRLQELADDASVPASRRVSQLLNDPALRRERTLFYGSGATDPERTKTPYAAKLFDVSERYVWVFVTASAAAGGRLPSLARLDVLYPGRTLMEDLPSIYQREEENPNSFLRALVGVLETNTQELDARIGSLGRYLDTSSAPGAWLDFLARWLGVPWDDALTLEQKRAVLARAAVLAKGRGTRAGLEALLAALLPGTPKKYRVTDATADHGFAVIGGDSCIGAALPALLGGSTQTSAQLGLRTVLGRMQLACPGTRDDGAWQLAGKVRVDVAANAAERAAWEPWLRTLIGEMVPLTARVELRWVTAQALRTNRLDGTLTIESAPSPHIGTDAITGLARLPADETNLTTGMRLGP